MLFNDSQIWFGFSYADSLHRQGWKHVMARFADKYPTVTKLMQLVLSLPASSSEAERGFSVLSVVKTDLRSRLSQGALNDLMIVKMCCAPITSFDPEPAFELWSSAAVRRPNQAGAEAEAGQEESDDDIEYYDEEDTEDAELWDKLHHYAELEE